MVHWQLGMKMARPFLYWNFLFSTHYPFSGGWSFNIHVGGTVIGFSKILKMNEILRSIRNLDKSLERVKWKKVLEISSTNLFSILIVSNNEFVWHRITRNHMRREINWNCLEGFPFILGNVEGSLWLQDTHNNLKNTSMTRWYSDYLLTVEPDSTIWQESC